MNPTLLILASIVCTMFSVIETSDMKAAPRAVVALIAGVVPTLLIWGSYCLITSTLVDVPSNQLSSITGLCGVLVGCLLIISLKQLNRSQLAVRLARTN